MDYFEIADQINIINRRASNLRQKQYELLKKMAHSEFVILIRLLKAKKEGKFLTVSELAKQLKLSSPAISRTVKNLVKKGWVQRTESQLDRRIVQLTVTDEGVSIAKEAKKELNAFMVQVYKKIDPEDLEAYILISSKLNDAAQLTYEQYKQTITETD